MAGPWERFQQAPEAAPGPWSRFAPTPEPETAQPEGARGFWPFLNDSIAGFYDLPFRASAGIADFGRGLLGMEPGPDVRPVRGLMSAAGVRLPEDGAIPETGAEYAGQYVGTAAAALPAQVLAAGRLAARQGASTVKGIGEAFSAPFRAAPISATSAELTAAAGSGLARSAADKASATGEADPITGMVAEVAGGVGAALVPGLAVRWVGAAGRLAENLPAVGFIVREVRDSFEPFTRAGSTNIARRRTQGVTADVDTARAALDGEKIADLSPAQRTGDRGLMALENSILSMDATLAESARRRSLENVKVLREALQEIPGGARTVDAQAAIAGRRSYVRQLLETRLQQAVDAADARLEALGPTRARTENAKIIAEELSKARTAARVQENQLWRAIPDETPVPTTSAKRAYQRFLSSLAGPEADDMPDLARRFLSGDTNESYGAETTIKEMLALRSKLLNEARTARSGDAPNLNRARIADDLAAAILDDLDAAAKQGGEIGGLIDTARAYSRAFAQAFKQGPVAEVSRTGRDGATRVEPGEVARRLMTGDESGVTNVDAVREAVQFPTAGAGPSVATDAVAGTDAAMRDYLRRRFVDSVMPAGDFNAKAAQRFMRSNDEVLARFPDLRQEFADAQQAKAMAARLGDRTQARVAGIGDRRASAAQDFTQRPRPEAFRAVADADDPAAAARQVVRQAASDGSGQGLGGVKASAVDYLMGRAEASAMDDGTVMISGRRMLSMLDDQRIGPALREVFSPEEIGRIRRIADEFSIIETSMSPGVDVGEALPKAPDTLMSYALTTLAARQGAKLGQGTSGASLKTASAASKRVQNFWNRFTNDGAKEVLIDAVQNPDTMRALLSDPADAAQAMSYLERRFLPAMAGVAAGAAGADRVGQPEIATPRDEAEWRALPPGTLFYDPTGQIRRR